MVIFVFIVYMKYKITDSKLDSVIFLYLDNQDFIQIEKGDKIYFVNSEGDKYAQIRYDKEYGWCYIHYMLVDEISRFFSLGRDDSKEVIGRWVENTLQMRVTHTTRPTTLVGLHVENTL
jgi:hypothetical protein